MGAISVGAGRLPVPAHNCQCTCPPAAVSTPGATTYTPGAVTVTLGAYAAPRTTPISVQLPAYTRAPMPPPAGTSGTPQPTVTRPGQLPSSPLTPASTSRWLKGDLAGLNPALAQRLAAVGAAIGTPLDIRSGARTRQEQEHLYQRYRSNPARYAVAAAPGSSRHETGNAADVYVGGVALRDHAAGREAAARAGLKFPVSSESWHTEVA